MAVQAGRLTAAGSVNVPEATCMRRTVCGASVNGDLGIVSYEVCMWAIVRCVLRQQCVAL